MSSLGTFLILTSFVLASGAFAASIAGARRGRFQDRSAARRCCGFENR